MQRAVVVAALLLAAAVPRRSPGGSLVAFVDIASLVEGAELGEPE